MPKADVRLVEDGYACPVVRTGHGLQRAFIITLLQHLAKAQAEVGGRIPAGNEECAPVSLPSLVLAIEEPELYQHPNRQRHLAKVLSQLSSGAIPGVAETTQIVYGTHSPFFVGLDRIEQLRVLRKVDAEVDKPKVTRIIKVSLEQVAEDLWDAAEGQGEKFTKATLLPRLHCIMTPWMSEGFFADVVVLVEGEDDRAALLGTAQAEGQDLESAGYSIIPCNGKTNIDRPLVIFRRLGIPTFIIWDGDNGDTPHANRMLLRLSGKNGEAAPATQVHEKFACFQRNLEDTLRSEIGPEDFDKWLTTVQDEFGISKKAHAMKNPVVVTSVVRKSFDVSKPPTTLREIIARLSALKKSSRV